MSDAAFRLTSDCTTINVHETPIAISPSVIGQATIASGNTQLDSREPPQYIDENHAFRSLPSCHYLAWSWKFQLVFKLSART